MQKNWLERLFISRTVAQFQENLEKLTTEVTSGSGALYYTFDSDNFKLFRQGQPVPVDDDSQPGSCALLREEITEGKSIPGWSGSPDGAVSVPVRYYGELVGVLTVIPGSSSNGNLLELSRQLADLAGVVGEQVALKEDTEVFSGRSRDVMVQAVEALAGGKGHVKRVARLCTELAAFLDLSAQVKADLFQAAHYHDVGLLMLSDRSPFEARQAHCQAGGDFLRCSRNLRQLVQLVESHHERYDGSGFPKGASGDDLPIDCWVLALAEALDEYWHDSKLTDYTTKLQVFFDEHAPTHHPEVVDALCGLVDSGRLKDVLR